MARRTSTSVTLEVTIKLPPKVTNPRAIDFILGAILHRVAGLPENDPMGKLGPSDIKVQLTKRNTTYA